MPVGLDSCCGIVMRRAKARTTRSRTPYAEPNSDTALLRKSSALSSQIKSLLSSRDQTTFPAKPVIVSKFHRVVRGPAVSRRNSKVKLGDYDA